MKRPLSLLLTLALTLSLLPAAWGAESVTPTPPSWVAAEDYLVFPGDPAYERSNWAQIEALRADAEKGAQLPADGRDWADGSVGQCYETALLRLKYAENAQTPEEEGEALRSAGQAFNAAWTARRDQLLGEDPLAARLEIEKYRAFLAYRYDYAEMDWGRALVADLDTLGMTLADFFDTPFMDRVSAEDRAKVEASVEAYWEAYRAEKERITVSVDGTLLILDTEVQVQSERTLIPIRAVAEALGADVEWVQETNEIIITRAGSTVTMTLDDPTADVDGEMVEMDVAPFAENERTYIPVRYVAEFFGQQVEWNETAHRVEITEDKGILDGSDLEDWLVSMGALLTLVYEGDPAAFGGRGRAPYVVVTRNELGEFENHTAAPRDDFRRLLAEEWDIGDRTALLEAVEELLTESGNEAFQDAADEVKHLSDAEIARRADKLSAVDKYMWPRTKALWTRWGKQGIRAWELCEAAALAQWGYTAGYLTYNEVIELLEPAARAVSQTFTSWDEVYENFLDGYYWCARVDLGDKTVWDTELGMAYLYLRNAPATAHLFDSGMFETGVMKAENRK